MTKRTLKTRTKTDLTNSSKTNRSKNIYQNQVKNLMAQVRQALSLNSSAEDLLDSLARP